MGTLYLFEFIVANAFWRIISQKFRIESKTR